MIVRWFRDHIFRCMLLASLLAQLDSSIEHGISSLVMTSKNFNFVNIIFLCEFTNVR